MVLAGQHLSPGERPFAWLGTQKPAAAAAAVAATLPPSSAPRNALQRLQATKLPPEAFFPVDLSSASWLLCVSFLAPVREAPWLVGKRGRQPRGITSSVQMLCGLSKRRLVQSGMNRSADVVRELQVGLEAQEQKLNDAHAVLQGGLRTQAASGQYLDAPAGTALPFCPSAMHGLFQRADRCSFERHVEPEHLT